MTEQHPFTVFDLLYTGYSFAKVGRIYRNRKLGPTHSDSLGMVQRIKDFCEFVECIDLPKSTKMANQVLKTIGKLEEALENYADATLYEETARKLRDDLKTLWNFVRDEASLQPIHIAEPFLWTEPFTEFIESPRKALGLKQAYQPSLPPEVDKNLEEAARHLTFDFYGGMIFFLLRGTEGVLKYYYRLLVGEDTNKTWGDLCGFLKHRDCEAPIQLVRAIELVKNGYRDPAMHVIDAEFTFNAETALNALVRCKAITQHMMVHLEDIGMIESLEGIPSELDFPEE